MRSSSLWAHVRDILLLPFTVTIMAPYFLSTLNNVLLVTVLLFGRIGKGTLATHPAAGDLKPYSAQEK